MMVATILGIFTATLLILIYTFGLSVTCSSGSVDTHLPECLSPWPFSLNIELNMLLSVSFMSHLDSLLGYSTGEFQALQVIVLVVFGAVD